MYGNLIIAMKQHKPKVTQADLARLLELSSQGTFNKVHGDSKFDSEEMFAIQERYFPDYEIKVLFKKS